MPVEPGSMFHPDSQNALWKAEQTVRIRECERFAPTQQREGFPKGDVPRGAQCPGGVMNRIGGAAAGVHSQLRLDSWEQKVSDRWVLATVARGYRLQFQRRPPPFSRVRITSMKDPVQADVLAEEIATLLQKDTIVKVSSSEQHTGFYSIFFLVPKKDGGLCPILDL